MRSFTAIILHACLAMAPAKELVQDPIDELVDKLIDKLIGRVMPTQSVMSRFAPMISPRATPMGPSLTHLSNFASRSEGSQPQVRVEAMRGNSMSMFPSVPALSVTPPGMINGPGMSVQAMQDSLQKAGVPPSPIQKLALTQLAATRDPSMKAQVREVFETLDPATQSKLRKASQEIIVKASSYQGYRSVEPTDVEDMALEDMAGATAPMGVWDPLGLEKGFVGLIVDAPPGRLYFYRECELKNGRAAMMAFVGILVTSPNGLGFKPFFDSGVEWDSFLVSHFADPSVNDKFWPALIIAAGFAELFSYPDRTKIPGDLGFDPLGFKKSFKGEKDFLDMQNKELNNGRLAMIAMAGLYAHELIAGVKEF